MRNLLFLRAHSLEEWRELSQTSHSDQMARLLKQAKTYDSYLPAAEHPRDSITYIGMAVANMALSYLLTEEESYLNTMRNWIRVGIGYPSWGLARKPDHDLDAAWLLFGLGLAYAWVGDEMPEDERIALRDKLIYQGIQMGIYGGVSEEMVKPDSSPDGAYFDPKAYMRDTLSLMDHVRSELGEDIELLHDVQSFLFGRRAAPRTNLLV